MNALFGRECLCIPHRLKLVAFMPLVERADIDEKETSLSVPQPRMSLQQNGCQQRLADLTLAQQPRTLAVIAGRQSNPEVAGRNGRGA